MTNALYNEIEPYACAWLDNLIAAGHVAPGRVERRSIADLTPDDVAGPGQRHFFAGIGGWSYALRLAGVPDDADVWTGSCPCQPFSSAGKRSGTRDPRHLWPTWFALIEQCRPPVIFGEQVASRDGLAWLDAVYADLERCGYAVGTADLCAAGIGAPHIRQRLYFVAFAGDERCERLRLHLRERRPGARLPEVWGGSTAARLVGDASSARSGRHAGWLSDAQASSEGEGCGAGRVADEPIDASSLGDAEAERRNARAGSDGWTALESRGPSHRCVERVDDRDVPDDEPHPNFDTERGMGDAAVDEQSRPARRAGMDRPQAEAPSGLDSGHRAEHAGAADGEGMADAVANGRRAPHGELSPRSQQSDAARSGEVLRDFWRPVEWRPCADGKSRPVEPGLKPLAHGVSGRVVVRRALEPSEAEVQGVDGSGIAEHWYNRTGALAGFGNAIVPELGAVFIEAAIAASEALKP